MLDKNAIPEYLKLVGFEVIEDKKIKIIEFETTDKSRFTELENLQMEYENERLEARYWENNRKN